MVMNSGVTTICWFDTQDLFSSRFFFFKYGLELDLPLLFIEIPGLFFLFASFSRRIFPENFAINHGQAYDFGDFLWFNLNVLDDIPIASVEQHISMNQPRNHKNWASIYLPASLAPGQTPPGSSRCARGGSCAISGRWYCTHLWPQRGEGGRSGGSTLHFPYEGMQP